MIDSTHGITQQDAQQFVSDVIRGWPSKQTFSAADVLHSQPGLQDHCSAVLDLAYEEYCQRYQQGESVDIEEFARQFPSVEETLRQLVKLNQLIDRDPASLGDSGSIPWPEVGQEFLEFYLLEELGRGFFSRVYLANELDLGHRPVVLKVSWGGHEEAFTLGQLKHPHIVPVNSVRHDPSTDLTAISLPFLGRATLFDVLSILFSEGGEPKSRRDFIDAVKLINNSDGTSDPKAAGRRKKQGSYVDAVVRIGSQLASALAHSHELGIYHGDIKPSNVLVTADGDALLFDFNLSVNALGTTSRFGGTLPYMSPEQLELFVQQGNKAGPVVDPRSEIYSLGVMLFETLCGQHPFGPLNSDRLRQDTAKVLLKRQQTGPNSLHELNGDVDPMLAALIESTLVFNPDQRPQTGGALATSLRALTAPRQRFQRRVINHPLASLLIASSMILGGVVGVGAWLSIPPKHQRELQTAETEYREGRFRKAAQMANLIVLAKPDCQRARYLRAESLMQSGQYRKSQHEFEVLCQQRPADARMRICLAHCIAHIGVEERNLGYIGDAVLQLEKLEAPAVKDFAYFNNLGFCRSELRRIVDAESALLASLKIDAAQPRPYILLAEIERRRFLAANGRNANRHLTAAKRHLRSALSIAQLDDAPRSDAYFQQGMLYATAALKLAAVDDELAKRYRDEAVNSLESAVRYGLSEKRLRSILGVNPLLEQAAGFSALCEQSRKNPPADRVRCLMHPQMVDDILPTLQCQ